MAENPRKEDAAGSPMPVATARPGPDRLAPPSSAATQLIRAHLAEHGIRRFQLDQHVYLGGPRRATQLVTWDPGRASFHCERCPGMVFGTGEVTPDQIDIAQLFDRGLQPHLAGLGSLEDRDEMTRLYLDGSLNRERLRQLRGADARRRTARGARPTVERRRERLQPWLLERVRALGVLERVLDEAEAMQRDDPTAWAALCDRPVSRETLRDYWQDLDPAVRAAAFAAGRSTGEKST